MDDREPNDETLAQWRERVLSGVREVYRLADLDQDGLDPRSWEADCEDGTYIRVWRYWFWQRHRWHWEIVSHGGVMRHFGHGWTRALTIRRAKREAKWWTKAVKP
jgi:hypothetical protein